MNVRAKVRAREILDKYCVKDPSDLNIREIANAENLMIKEEDTRGHIGRIYIEGDAGIITIDNKIKETGRKNFTIAHEIGHFSLEKEREYFCSKADMLNFRQKKNYEQEANIFAAELLMPEEWIKKYVKWKDEALGTLEEAAELLSTDGMLIKRPLVTDGKKITFGFKEEDFEKEWVK